MNHIQERGYVKTCCDCCFDAFTGCKNNDCPCHTPQTKETESNFLEVDIEERKKILRKHEETESVDAVADEIHGMFASAYAIGEKVNHEWIKNKLISLQATNQAKIDDAVEKALRNVPVGFVRQWINEDLLKDGHRLVTNEDIQDFINIALKKDI